jgi:glutathione peroxidase
MPAASHSKRPCGSRHNDKAFRIPRFYALALTGLPFSRNFAQPTARRRAIVAAMISRRHFVLLGAASLVSVSPRFARATAMSHVTAYAFTFKGLDGGDILLSSFAGHPLLVVNTASLCGYTPQYAGLQALWSRYHDKGLTVLGVPSNDFGGQEPGGVTEIHATAQGEYHVTFPITEKVAVKGKDAHPFFKWAALERPLEAPRWNFHKYLVGRDGYLKAGFTSAVEPTDPLIVAAIEKELARE